MKNLTDILAAVASGELSADDAQKLLDQKPERQLGLKISDKGAISLTGIRRFPISLYANEWQKVLAFADKIAEFIEANKERLSFAKKETTTSSTEEKVGTSEKDAA